MPNPFFSVVIPTYNRENLVIRAIKSVASQTFKDFELIVADDCSTDRTREIVEEFELSNLYFHQNIENKGNAGARNLGARNARGNYICYLDSDDCYHKNYLEEMMSLINKRNNPDFLWCQVNRFDQEGKLVPKTDKIWNPTNAGNPYLFFLKGLGFGTDHGFIIKKDVFDQLGGFDENLRTAVDTDFILRLVQSEKDFAFTTKVLVDTFDHEGVRVRKDTLKKFEAYKRLYLKHKKTINKHKNLKSYWFGKMMWLAYHNNQKEEARSYLLKSIKSSNFKSILISLFFEILSIDKAIELHKQISNRVKA